MLHANKKLFSSFFIGLNLSLMSCGVLAEDMATTPVEASVGASVDPRLVTSVVPSSLDLSPQGQRLQPFIGHADYWSNYQAQKAKMWLTYAANEGSERSLTTAKQQAEAEAEKIITGLEQSQEITTTTTVLTVSSVMRRDLWANAELLKQHAGFECANTEVAQAEVMLVWAAAEHCELGWRHSRELFAAAERLIDKANYQAFNCKANLPKELPKISYPSFEELNGSKKGCNGVVGKWPIWSPEPIKPDPAPILVAKSLAIEEPVPNVVHFALDKSDLSASSKDVLNRVAVFLNEHPNHAVTLYGFTDSRASVAYNLALSKRRANAVSDYLVAHGVALSRIAQEAKGKVEVIADNNAVMGHALSRRVELVYADPEGKEVDTIRQQVDVQLER
jgi:outer membrane protein OmpA-like peptidoglycan-associated protein